MLTVDRAALGGVNYIHRALESFRQEYPTATLNLYVGHLDTSYLGSAFGSPFHVRSASTPTDKPKRFLGSWNYYRALAAVEGYESLLLLEDDIVFTVRFKDKLRERIAAIPVARFILSLFTVRDVQRQPVEEIDPEVFSGTQAIYFPPSVVPELRDWFQERLVGWTSDTPENDISHDLMISQWCEETGIPIYVSHPSLVNHIGLTSSVIDTRTATSCAQAAAFHLGIPKSGTLQPAESFCTFCTARYAGELKLLLKSIELFHPGVPVYVDADFVTSRVIANCPNAVVSVSAEPLQLRTLFAEYDARPGNRERSDHNRGGLYLLKMEAIAAAMEHHNNTVYLDSDILLTAPFEPQPRCDAALALHWFSPFQSELEKSCGHYNAGTVFVASKEFLRWWREAYLTHGWTDQGCLSTAPSLFDVHILPLEHNFGWWRIWNHTGGFRIDFEHSTSAEVAAFCGITADRDGIRLHGEPLKSFHCHLLAGKRFAANEALKRLVLYCLENSDDPRHGELLEMFAKSKP